MAINVLGSGERAECPLRKTINLAGEERGKAGVVVIRAKYFQVSSP